MQLSPTLTATGTYPFVKLEQAKRRLAAEGIELIDFGKGDPREPTDGRIRAALADELDRDLLVPARRRAGGAARVRRRVVLLAASASHSIRTPR